MTAPYSNWIVAQLGAREHYAVPRAFHISRQLEVVYTDIWMNRQNWLSRLSPSLRSLHDRYHAGIPPQKIKSFNRSFLSRHLLQKANLLKFPSFFDKDIYYGSLFAKKVRDDITTIDLHPEKHSFFGFSSASLETLQYLKEKEIPTLVDQIDPGRVELEIVLAEARKWEGWDLYELQPHECYFDRLQSEWGLATNVLVNSEWSRQALIQQGVDADKIIMVPLAFEPSLQSTVSDRKPLKEFTVLFLGAVILRKGIQYLIEAARLLKDFPVKFIVAGPIGITEEALARVPSNMTFTGKVNRSRVPEYYTGADIFVLPTLSDGFALTQLEAMSYGLPVIATHNCGAVVQEGINGFVIPPADPTTLANRILTLYQEKDLLDEMRVRAIQRSGEFSLKNYRDTLQRQWLPVNV